MRNMVRYEIKKVFSKTGGKVALGLLLALIVITSYFATDVYFVNEDGEQTWGFAAIANLRAAHEPWSGVLDEERIGQVIAENYRIAQTPQYRSEDVKQSNIAYGWRQGFARIRGLINWAYTSDFETNNYYLSDSLSDPSLAKDFYANRVKVFRAWLERDEVIYRYSDAEREYLLRQYESIKTPFYMEYMEGWLKALKYSQTVIMISMMIVGYLVTGIFAGEFQWKSDSILFSSTYGRSRAVTAKLKAGFLIVTAVYGLSMAVYTAIVLGYLGASGANCPVQVEHWKEFYNITIGQQYLITVIGGYIGSLFMALLVMWISSKGRSAVVAIMTPVVLIFLPSFVGNIPSVNVSKILSLLPDRLLQMNVSMKTFDLFDIGGKVIPAVPIILVLYSVLAIMLVPATYMEYRSKEIM